jgi:glycerol-3-phosphate acyltransferase PlsX
LKDSFEVIGADDIVSPDDKPSAVLRKSKNTSMGKSLEWLQDKKVDALVSAGNTGALMALSKFKLRTLSGISRPAIATTIPHAKGEFVMLDLGANIECNTENIVQFAIMGSEFAKVVLGKTSPKIGILNVGTEQEKGKATLQEASEFLKKSYLAKEFTGFVEGNEITNGVVDVVVTDGFSGNIALKTAEGIAKLCSVYIKKMFSDTFLGKISYFLIKKSLQTLKIKLDPRNRNGALFLGLNGIVVKSHGGADDLSFAAAIDIALEFSKEGVGDKIVNGLNSFNLQDKIID